MSKHLTKNGAVIAIHSQWTRIVLPNGKEVHGVPQHTPEYKAQAFALGYEGYRCYVS